MKDESEFPSWKGHSQGTYPIYSILEKSRSKKASSALPSRGGFLPSKVFANPSEASHRRPVPLFPCFIDFPLIPRLYGTRRKEKFGDGTVMFFPKKDPQVKRKKGKDRLQKGKNLLIQPINHRLTRGIPLEYNVYPGIDQIIISLSLFRVFPGLLRPF